MLSSSEHPLKHDMNEFTDEQPLKTSAGMLLIFVLENVCSKVSHFVLFANSPAGISTSPEPVKAIRNDSQSGWFLNIPAGTEVRLLSALNTALNVVILGLLANKSSLTD